MADAQRAAKRKRYTSNIITLEVGHNKEQLTIHEDTLKSSSPFFTAALEKQWKEGKTRVIRLPDDDFDVVAAYVHWINVKQLEHDDKTKPKWDTVFFARLYVFGEKVLDDEFCDTVISAIAEEVDVNKRPGRRYPGAFPISIIYNGTAAGSPARAFMVDLYKEGGFAHWFTTWGEEEWPAEFLFDLTKAFMPAKRALGGPLFSHKREKWFKNKPSQA